MDFDDQPSTMSRKRAGAPIEYSLHRKKCLLCNCNVKLYRFKGVDMLLGCENFDCSFPVGYEAMQVVTSAREWRNIQRNTAGNGFIHSIPQCNTSMSPPPESRPIVSAPTAANLFDDASFAAHIAAIMAANLDNKVNTYRELTEFHTDNEEEERLRSIRTMHKNLEKYTAAMKTLRGERNASSQQWLRDMIVLLKIGEGEERSDSDAYCNRFHDDDDF